jgi:hypothetical protein
MSFHCAKEDDAQDIIDLTSWSDGPTNKIKAVFGGFGLSNHSSDNQVSWRNKDLCLSSDSSDLDPRIDLTGSIMSCDSVEMVRKNRSILNDVKKLGSLAKRKTRQKKVNNEVVHPQKEKLDIESVHSEDHDTELLCVVCQENQRDTVLLPCRHLCTCGKCASVRLLAACPLCREEIDAVLKVYV